MPRRLEIQAEACASMGSPFTAELVRGVLGDYLAGGGVRELLDSHPEFARPALHLASALHYLALTGEPSLSRHYPSVGGDGDGRAAWAAGRRILSRDPDSIAALYVDAVQTNEPARSMPILGALLTAAAEFEMPFCLFEVGASAGLNLRFDRYRYDGGSWRWGDADSPLVLRNRVRHGRPKHRDARIEVVERRGCDPHPVDVNSAEARLRLASFVWPDQTERLQRVRAALEIAAAVPAAIDPESFATWLPREAVPRASCVTAIVHTVVEEHLSHADRSRLHQIVAASGERASAEAPMAYIRMELQSGTYPTVLTCWPGAKTTTICASDGHAQELIWM